MTRVVPPLRRGRSMTLPTPTSGGEALLDTTHTPTSALDGGSGHFSASAGGNNNGRVTLAPLGGGGGGARRGSAVQSKGGVLQPSARRLSTKSYSPQMSTRALR